MRLEAQMKGGFYPAPIEALDLMLTRVTAGEGCTILDPCAGRGEAVAHIAGKLGIPEAGVHAVELEEGRSAAIRAAMPEAKILAPADYLQTDISASSFSMAWCNPPFDDEIGGGGRVEFGFLDKSIRLVATKGLVALVCPEAVMHRHEMRELFLRHCENVSVTMFPGNVRRFTEIMVLGTKRRWPVQAVSGDWMSTVARGHRLTYTLPTAPGPRRFVKTGLTEAELLRALAKSPLNDAFRGVVHAPMASPPLELSRGQLALVLAGGLLNTTLQKPGEEPILIKATPFKETYVSAESEEVKNEGSDNEDLLKTVVTSERIKLKVRVMDPSGTIHDLT